MATNSRIGVVMVATVACCGPARPAHAQGTPHVRAQTNEARELIADAAARSPSVREMIDRLDRSDVFVYIRHRVFTQTSLEGRIGILAVVQGRRYLAVELACSRHRSVEIAALGHELHHALEIAGEPSIVDGLSLAAHYQRIGFRSDAAHRIPMFETEAARAAGLQVRRELFVRAARTAD